MVFGEGQDAVPVRWFFPPDSAVWMPDGNVFDSANWCGKEVDAGDLGEQPGARTWKNGANTKGYLGTVEDCLDPSWFVDGLPTGETTGPWDSDSRLECCTPAPPPTSICDVDLSTYTGDLVVTLASPGGCLDGTVWVMPYGGVDGFGDPFWTLDFGGPSPGADFATATLLDGHFSMNLLIGLTTVTCSLCIALVSSDHCDGTLGAIPLDTSFVFDGCVGETLSGLVTLP